jgi:hypothetical protein
MADFEYIETEEVGLNGLQVYQQDKAIIDMQIATAKQYPRDLKRAIEKCITFVTMDKSISEKMFYTLKKGGKTIVGPSVNLAKIMAQQMGNMRVENRVVGFDATHVTCEAVCFDLETNYAVRTQIKKSIVGSSGRYSEDMCTITANAGNAIALRNAIFNCIGMDLVDKVYNAAKQNFVGDLSDINKLVARRTLLIETIKQNYASHKLTDEEIARAVGKETISHIKEEEIIVLIGLEKAIAEGEQTVETVFRPTLRGTPAPPVVGDKSAERIILLINSCKTQDTLKKLLKDCNTPESKLAYDAKWTELSAKE